jgi:hypothetical protein
MTNGNRVELILIREASQNLKARELLALGIVIGYLYKSYMDQRVYANRQAQLKTHNYSLFLQYNFKLLYEFQGLLRLQNKLEEKS